MGFLMLIKVYCTRYIFTGNSINWKWPKWIKPVTAIIYKMSDDVKFVFHLERKLYHKQRQE